MTYVPSLSAIQIYTLDEDRCGGERVLFFVWFFLSFFFVEACSSRSLVSIFFFFFLSNRCQSAASIPRPFPPRILSFDAGASRTRRVLPDKAEKRARGERRDAQVRGKRMSDFGFLFSCPPYRRAEKKSERGDGDKNRGDEAHHQAFFFLPEKLFSSPLGHRRSLRPTAATPRKKIARRKQQQQQQQQPRPPPLPLLPLPALWAGSGRRPTAARCEGPRTPPSRQSRLCPCAPTAANAAAAAAAGAAETRATAAATAATTAPTTTATTAKREAPRARPQPRRPRPAPPSPRALPLPRTARRLPRDLLRRRERLWRKEDMEEEGAPA